MTRWKTAQEPFGLAQCVFRTIVNTDSSQT